jgi:hypothetical protein
MWGFLIGLNIAFIDAFGAPPPAAHRGLAVHK